MNLVGVTILCILSALVAGFFAFIYGLKVMKKAMQDAADGWKDVAERRTYDLEVLRGQLDTEITCPVCEGTGELHTRSDNTCQCCYGEKTISASKLVAITRARNDLNKKLQERGNEYE